MRIRRLIEGLAQKYGSVNAAARACGMPEGSMRNLYIKDQCNPTLETLTLLARGYGKSLTEIVALLEDEDQRVTSH